jgi:hypothetical protein
MGSKTTPVLAYRLLRRPPAAPKEEEMANEDLKTPHPGPDSEDMVGSEGVGSDPEFDTEEFEDEDQEDEESADEESEPE